MGVLVSGPGPLLPSSLPIPPPPPLRTNLDVTALCALCSEVCNGGVDSPEVAAWAAGTSHWEVLHSIILACPVNDLRLHIPLLHIAWHDSDHFSGFVRSPIAASVVLVYMS